MNDENQENLKDLFEKFLDAEQAESCAEDVQKAEEILREHPAPEPDAMLIANIKAEIAMRLPAKRAYVFKHIAYKVACAAAAVIFITAIGLNLFQKGPHEPNGMQSNPHSDCALALAVSGRDIVVVIASSRVSNAISDQERTERYTSIILWATKSSSRSLIASRP